MDEELRSLTERLRRESGGGALFERLAADDGPDALAAVLTEPGQ
ncbi:adenylosuccinate lyase, partial [Streptomyces sp. S6]